MTGSAATRNYGEALCERTSASVAVRYLEGEALTVDLGMGEVIEFVRVPSGQGLLGGETGMPVWFCILAATNALVFLWVFVSIICSVWKGRFQYSLRGLVLLVSFIGLSALTFHFAVVHWDRLNRYPAPSRNVRFERPFYMAKYEITKGQYSVFMGTRASRDEARLPVSRVSWHDAIAFCDWLSRKTGMRCRLPTEDEWEWAARGRSSTRFPNGMWERDLAKAGWYASISGNRPHEVGLKEANGFGLHDVCGNVSEWCLDGPEERLEERFLRGGSFNVSPESCGLASRRAKVKDFRYRAFGFRVLVEAQPDSRQTK